MRRPLYYIFLFIKGLCIGATGVLQGISGGSMALLLGIHQEFIFSLRQLDRASFKLLRQKKISVFWKKINGNFLLALVTGIATGLLTLRTVFNSYFSQYPIFISTVIRQKE